MTIASFERGRVKSSDLKKIISLLNKQLSYVDMHDKIKERDVRQNEKGLEKKFEQKKVRIAEKVELFSSQTFSSKFFFGSYGTRGATTIADHLF